MDAMRGDVMKIFATTMEDLEQGLLDSRRRWAFRTFLRPATSAVFDAEKDALSEAEKSWAALVASQAQAVASKWGFVMVLCGRENQAMRRRLRPQRRRQILNVKITKCVG